MALGDGEAFAYLFEGDGGGSFKFFCGEAGSAELRGKRHGEAAGMRGSEEFFGIGADTAFKARMKRVSGLFEDSAVGRESAFAGFEVALPDRGSFALHKSSPFGTKVSADLNLPDSIREKVEQVY